MSSTIQFQWQFDVYRLSVEGAMSIFEKSKNFPADERFSLTDQIRRSSRSVSAQIGEGWRKRKSEAAFVSKLADAEGEAGETQVWLEYAVKCGYPRPRRRRRSSQTLRPNHRQARRHGQQPRSVAPA